MAEPKSLGAPARGGVVYTAHFGLTEPPFSITPDPRYLYMSARHREGLAHLLYGIGEGGGFVQLTGEVGTGKTTLCRCLLEQLPPEVDVALILNPKLTDIELLAAVCDELGIAYPPGTESRKLLVDKLYQYLLDAHGRGRRTVLIIDEAQDLAPDVLEQIRLLTNLETSTWKLLQIILIGQPELIRLLARDDLRQLAQRVVARYHLRPFTLEDTHAYIRHRMGVAGQKEKIFTDAAMRQAHLASRGIPRLINAVCDRALLGAYAQDKHRVDAATMRRAAREVLGRPAARSLRRWLWTATVCAVVVVAGIGILLSQERVGLTAAGVTSVRPAPSVVSSVPVADPPVTGIASPQTSRENTGEIKPPRLQPMSLAELLSDPSLPADRQSAFRSLYAQWGVQFGETAAVPSCEREQPRGLHCLLRTGTWAKLRRIDLPAIIELATPSLERRYATVVAITDDTATLDFGGRPYTFPFSEVDRYWEGPFVVLWRGPELRSVSVEPGTRGKDVEWVRQRLSELDGAPITSRNRDVFDNDLRARVINFQRSRALAPDGIVGEETLAHLSLTPRDPNIPRLSRPDRS
ncbi:MAG TPA: AAA family ATPase [Candidatus Methylomirabilis sp.]|nr:AAA family ATPase [Candidatus Methylomirabilis sp.]